MRCTLGEEQCHSSLFHLSPCGSGRGRAKDTALLAKMLEFAPLENAVLETPTSITYTDFAKK